MSLWQYKDASRAELWEILQIQLEETQRLTAYLDDLQTFFDSCYEELQATRVAHDKIKQERDELLSLIYNTAIGELTMSYKVDIGSMASAAYSITGINQEKLTKQAEDLTDE